MLELYREEQPHLRPLPLEGFRYFTQGVRTVDDAGLVQIASAYYAAAPAPLYGVVTVRVYAQAIEILDAEGRVLRRHQHAVRKGAFVMEPRDGAVGSPLQSLARDRARAGARRTDRPAYRGARARPLRALGPSGQSRALWPGEPAAYVCGTYARVDIEAMCARLLAGDCISYAAVKGALTRHAARAPVVVEPPLTQSGPGIRALTEYQTFWEQHATDDRANERTDERTDAPTDAITDTPTGATR